ncbi:Na+/H+ antiporter [Brachybacterium nesterenkovii]|uniref:Na+/H+ antiporter n=1 Tax=Brachybacterium nesterenkovii TaxID=47847 RepID=A0A1X6WU12_9MICO|nr:Na+/H+ antiporter [Brachybacterium nesterenkovii]SLM88608.1 Na+/H+ antiporter [Brachybacterium nesterenkovii]
MHTTLLLVGLTVAVLAGTALSERLRLPAPMVLIALGAIGSFLPFVPEVALTPDLVLIGLLPPLLYASSMQTSIIDIRANLTSVALLSVALVAVTTVTVGAVAHALVPGISWAAALALGAVVAPPDAVSASAVARRIGLPRRIVTVLEGESLLNDATALVALRTAVAALSGTVAAGAIALDFLVAAGGGALLGIGVAAVVLRLRARIRDPLIDTGVSFVVPFVAYLLAEELHASGVIAVVVAGLIIGHRAPIVQTSGSRLTERVTWSTVAFLLEHAVFLLIGLQATRIVTGLDGSVSVGRMLTACAAVLGTVIATRLLWVLLTQWLRGLRTPPEDREPWSHALVTGWAGMRGVVTIAAVFVIPAEVPHHDLLVLIALAVVLGTLYLQGLTLPVLTRALGVEPQDPAADALARATLLQQAADAGLAELDACTEADPHGVETVLRDRLDRRTFAAWERLSTTTGIEAPSEAYTRIRTRMIAAERARILEIRSLGKVPSHVVREVLGMLDLEESMLDAAREEREEIVATGIGQGGHCAELRSHPAIATTPDPRCAQCEAEGTVPVALRQCLECGSVGCCDSSPGQHATEHFHRTGHAVMQSAEPGETWRWCYVHAVTA